MLLNIGKTYQVNHHVLQIKELLGSGGQGEVYKVIYRNKKYALKVYFKYPSLKFRMNLKNNVELQSPADSFLWPVETFDNGACFGYLMPLRNSVFKSFVSYLNGQSEFDNEAVKITWLIHLCEALQSLHRKGLSFLDLNDGNLFLNGTTGDLEICDTDNIAVHKTVLGILGKTKYMAPELVLGLVDPLTGKRQMPDIYTDRWSLSVIIFMTLCMGDPFSGQLIANYDVFDDKAMKDIYGNHPVFIFSDVDETNRPIRGYHYAPLKLWPILPVFIQKAFHQVFQEGISNRQNKRLMESEWISLLERYREQLITCPSCKKQFSYDVLQFLYHGQCPYCRKSIREIRVLAVHGKRIPLEIGKTVYRSDVFGPDGLPVFEVVCSKSDPNLLGFRLLEDTEIQIEDLYGNTKRIQKGACFPILKGLKITFSPNIMGEIQ